MSKSDLSPVEMEVQRALENHFNEAKDPLCFVIGVSGGADSMGLLHIFYSLGIEVIVAHINYGKRGKEAEGDEALVKMTADKWGFDCQVLTVDPADVNGQNFQQWARRIRYGFFNKLKEERGANGIALGHHQDDQIETILQKLFRGAGLQSWSAMQMWDGELFRPLLHVSRQKIEHYCRQKDIAYRTDRSNLSSEFARNFLRNEWMKDLEKHFPGWRKNIIRISVQADLFAKALTWISDYVTDENDRIVRIPFLELDGKLRNSLILHNLKKMDPGISVSGNALMQLKKLSQLQTGKSIQLTPMYSVLRDREWFKIVYEVPTPSVLVTLVRDELNKKFFLIDGLHFSIQDYADPDFENSLYLDTEKLSWPLTLRIWSDGDRFQPLGMEGHQNISDHLTNRKISAAHKSNALVLETSNETVCALLFPPLLKCKPPGTISELVKCDTTTKKSLIIKHS